jgi:glucose/arabinose dehydrogenase
MTAARTFRFSVHRAALLGCAALVALHCSRSADEQTASKQEAAPAPQAAPAPKPPEPAAPLAPSEPTTQVDGIPTEVDYEKEAAERITPDNLEAELDRLEQEIQAD